MSLPEVSLESAAPGDVPARRRPPRPWKFVGTILWGAFAFGAMFAGQIAVTLWFLVRGDAPVDFAAFKDWISSGVTISLSVLMGLPAALAALWLATRVARMPFAEYLAMRGTSWKNFLRGAGALIVVIAGWDLFSRATGREVAPGFMIDVMKSAELDGALWLLAIAFCVAAPVTETR
jgi:hypothetical protein